MTRYGHPPGLLDPPLGAALVGQFALPRGHRFTEHAHPTHQLAWAERGVLTVSAGATTWVLPPTRALWIPADLPHTTSAATSAAMHGVYLRPDRAPTGWARPTVLGVGPLLAALIGHLGQPDLDDEARGRAEAVLFDQLRPAPVASVELVWPQDARARLVADALADDPADDRDTAGWARLAGTSARTLTRLFLRDTGCTIGRWRSRIRIRRALELLAADVPITATAHQIGYHTPSAFVAAFRRELGTTPARIFIESARGL